MKLDPKKCDSETRNALPWMRVAALASLVFAAPCSSSQARAEESRRNVDLKLVIAVDVSRSMTQNEQRVQRQGYVNALLDPGIMTAIKSGARGRIAIAYLEWANPDYQRVLVPWKVIDRPEDAAAFADALDAQPTVSEGGTSISAGLLQAMILLETNDIQSDRQTIDVSGDGPNNAGPPVVAVRDALVARGVTINGLAISVLAPDQQVMFDSPSRFVEAYYQGCVIGGPNNFVIAVGDVKEFTEAILRKMLTEIAGTPLQLQLAAYRAPYPPITECGSWGEHPGR
jgi:Mg-chelatase subunit ChlD